MYHKQAKLVLELSARVSELEKELARVRLLLVERTAEARCLREVPTKGPPKTPCPQCYDSPDAVYCGRCGRGEVL